MRTALVRSFLANYAIERPLLLLISFIKCSMHAMPPAACDQRPLLFYLYAHPLPTSSDPGSKPFCRLRSGRWCFSSVFAVAVPFFDPDEAPCSAPISAAKSSVFPVPLGFAPEAVELPLLPVLWFPPRLFVPLFMIVIPELPPTFVVVLGDWS
jgi:hypothetical protein